MIFYDTFKSTLCTSTSCAGNEIHAEMIAFVPCCFEPNGMTKITTRRESTCSTFGNSYVRTCRKWKHAMTTEKSIRDLLILNVNVCKVGDSAIKRDWRSNNDRNARENLRMQKIWRLKARRFKDSRTNKKICIIFFKIWRNSIKEEQSTKRIIWRLPKNY